MQAIKKYLKFGLLGAILVAGVQFSLVYINRMQLKNIMDAEALDGRRAGSAPAEIEKAIRNRARNTGVGIPGDVTFKVTGTGSKTANLEVHATYTDTVDLFIRKIPMPMQIHSEAAPPAF